MQRKGFTLLELMMVITILGILISVAVQRIAISGVAAKGECCKQYVSDLNKALETHYVQSGTYITNLSDLAGSEFYPESIPMCPVTGQPFVLDATTGRIKHAGH